MKRLWHIWLAFGACLVLVLAAMAWISANALRLERVEAGASLWADHEENMRLALWRMDSALSPLITRESARPYFSYSAFYPIDRAYTRMFAQITPDEVIVGSPLLTYRSEMIRLHFQIDPAGAVTSPQAPAGNERDLAETGYTGHAEILAAAAELDRLKAVLSRQALVSALPAPEAPTTAPAVVLETPTNTLRRALPNPAAQMRQQTIANNSEFQYRMNAAQGAAGIGRDENLNLSGVRQGVAEGATQAVWVGTELVLVRRVSIGGSDYVQGCWLNWPSICRWLLEGVGDILPEADLRAASAGPSGGGAYRLAALPVCLSAPAPRVDGQTAYASPLRMSLLIAWACVLAGAAAVAGLLAGAVRLSERRGAFVSAVTHELRTPLTTFRLYAEMLAEGMVTDPDKRLAYAKRLRDESDRLGHLVENVLAYARLSRGRSGSPQPVALGELIERMRERLNARAQRAQMTLSIEDTDTAADLRVMADASLVEQILLNLVDNACKYASRAEDRRIEIALARRGRFGAIRVHDHGPGIGPDQSRRLFQAFSKSADQAARSAPGVGLGLALSRRLARDMDGELALDPKVREGACFVLTLRQQPV